MACLCPVLSEFLRIANAVTYMQDAVGTDPVPGPSQEGNPATGEDTILVGADVQVPDARATDARVTDVGTLGYLCLDSPAATILIWWMKAQGAVWSSVFRRRKTA